MITSLTRTLIVLCWLTHIGYAQEKKNMTLLDHWFQDSLVTNSTSVRYSGCWGFDFEGSEYAVIGSTEGTHVFQIKDKKLHPAGFVEGKYNSSMVIHREFKTYKNYLYSICDEGNSSLQIIDLSYLPDSIVLVADIQDSRIGRCHNLFIDTTNDLLFACLVTPIISGTPTSVEPMRVFSLADPLDPQILWTGPDDIPEVHDCYVRDRKAILNCGTNGIRVYDFTNASSPSYINNLTFYTDQGYNHQGWLSPDGDTYVFADETNGKKVKRCSVDDAFNLQVTGSFGTAFNEGSVPHNIMISDTFAYVAYYNEGVRIFDLRDPVPHEVAFYDTYPDENIFKMNGAWGVYSQYSNNQLIVSDRQYGLFLLEFNSNDFSAVTSIAPFTFYPNPSVTGQSVTIRSTNDEISQFYTSIYSADGRLVYEKENDQSTIVHVPTDLSVGSYFVRIFYENYLGNTAMFIGKVIIH
ncbi:MAG: choice-of-anchor B family protein [Bacteroidetes bacterium]|nr:MAG: choice-of-anchor B family protein [Bacteroidota bacterium]